MKLTWSLQYRCWIAEEMQKEKDKVQGIKRCHECGQTRHNSKDCKSKFSPQKKKTAAENGGIEVFYL